LYGVQVPFSAPKKARGIRLLPFFVAKRAEPVPPFAVSRQRNAALKAAMKRNSGGNSFPIRTMRKTPLVRSSSPVFRTKKGKRHSSLAFFVVKRAGAIALARFDTPSRKQKNASCYFRLSVFLGGVLVSLIGLTRSPHNGSVCSSFFFSSATVSAVFMQTSNLKSQQGHFAM
jgi:hypothetical protein